MFLKNYHPWLNVPIHCGNLVLKIWHFVLPVSHSIVYWWDSPMRLFLFCLLSFYLLGTRPWWKDKEKGNLVSLPRGSLGKVWSGAGARASKELRFRFLGTWLFSLEDWSGPVVQQRQLASWWLHPTGWKLSADLVPHPPLQTMHKMLCFFINLLSKLVQDLLMPDFPIFFIFWSPGPSSQKTVTEEQPAGPRHLLI